MHYLVLILLLLPLFLLLFGVADFHVLAFDALSSTVAEVPWQEGHVVVEDVTRHPTLLVLLLDDVWDQVVDNWWSMQVGMVHFYMFSIFTLKGWCPLRLILTPTAFLFFAEFAEWFLCRIVKLSELSSIWAWSELLELCTTLVYKQVIIHVF